MKKIDLVIDLGFGDGGKGATVNALIKYPKNTMVVRFGGGHQVGHTVNHDGNRHTFSNFGSGALKGVSTYYSQYCTVDPKAIALEGKKLFDMLGYNPKLFFHPEAMVVTPYDINANIKDSRTLKHGSVGVGFGKTIQRNEDYHHLYVRDLFYPKIRDEKLRLVAAYYKKSEAKDLSIDFKRACDEFVEKYRMVSEERIAQWCDNYIFEGHQGIMLDQHYGFFPNVTRSNTTSKNAIKLINKWFKVYKSQIQVKTYYITRAYQTRHGNGYMTNEDRDNSWIEINPNEANTNTGWQGVFRRAELDLDQLKYAVECDRQHNTYAQKNLVMTCIDHLPIDVREGKTIPLTKNGRSALLTLKEIQQELDLTNFYTSISEEGVDF